jgi:hypothetical protein
LKFKFVVEEPIGVPEDYTQGGGHWVVSFCITVLRMFKIKPFYCINWPNIVLNSLRKVDSGSAKLIGCWWCLAIYEYGEGEGKGGGSGAGTG